MKTEDERIAKPGIVGSLIFIVIFILVLIWFGVNEEEQDGSGENGSATGALALSTPAASRLTAG